jgi:hypothetical protein
LGEVQAITLEVSLLASTKEFVPMQIRTIRDYLKHFAAELGERVVQQFPALHKPGDAPSPFLRRLKRQPFPGQELTIMELSSCGSGARPHPLLSFPEIHGRTGHDMV